MLDDIPLGEYDDFLPFLLEFFFIDRLKDPESISIFLGVLPNFPDDFPTFGSLKKSTVFSGLSLSNISFLSTASNFSLPLEEFSSAVSDFVFMPLVELATSGISHDVLLLTNEDDDPDFSRAIRSLQNDYKSMTVDNITVMMLTGNVQC